jgi:hypothetical protein
MAGRAPVATIRSMASFLVETYVRPGDHEAFSLAVDGLRDAVATATPAARCRYVRSYLVPRDELGVHVVEAEDSEAVSQAAKVAGIEVERIVAAIGIDGDPAAGREQQ